MSFATQLSKTRVRSFALSAPNGLLATPSPTESSTACFICDSSFGMRFSGSASG